MTRLGRRQVALLCLGCGDLFGDQPTIREERGPRGGLRRVTVSKKGERETIPADTLRRLIRRRLYKAGRITEAGVAAYDAWRGRGADR